MVDAEAARLMFEGVETLARNAAGYRKDERVWHIRPVGDRLLYNSTDLLRRDPPPPFRLETPFPFGSAAAATTYSLPRPKIAAAVRAEPPDWIGRTAPIHFARASQLSDQIFKLPVA